MSSVKAQVTAQEIVGEHVELSHKPTSKEELVTAYEDHCDRVAELILAHVWTQQREKLGFEVEMHRWAFAHGSQRLRMGIEDGYRMVPVYLTERIEREVPGSYAYARENRDGVSWQPRTGPTEVALTWRRAIQAKLDEHRSAGMRAVRAEIVWMKVPPLEMCDDDRAWARDYDGDPYERLEIPFEAIAVPNWLGRYTLLAGVISEEFTVPDYLLLSHVLDPSHYGVEGLPKPPRGGATIPDCHIPTDTGDLVRSRARLDDDIPF